MPTRKPQYLFNTLARSITNQYPRTAQSEPFPLWIDLAGPTTNIVHACAIGLTNAACSLRHDDGRSSATPIPFVPCQLALGIKYFQYLACGPIEVIPTPQAIDCDPKSHSANSSSSNSVHCICSTQHQPYRLCRGGLPRWVAPWVSSYFFSRIELSSETVERGYTDGLPIRKRPAHTGIGSAGDPGAWNF